MLICGSKSLLLLRPRVLFGAVLRMSSLRPFVCAVALLTIVQLFTVATHARTHARTQPPSPPFAKPFLGTHPARAGALNQHWTDDEYRAMSVTDGAGRTIHGQFLDQKLDHQDLSDTRTFQQLFFINDTYWNSSNPIIFLNIGGEGPINANYVADSFFILGELCAKYGALQAVLEHRFYGTSYPMDISVGGLKYLSSSQALGDLVTFHEYLTNYYNVTAKWILFGGSYSGSLSAWARLKYPNLFLGAISSSAPVEARLDYPQYQEVMSESMGPSCNALYSAAFDSVVQLLVAPYAELASLFNLCQPMQTWQDETYFLQSLTGPFAQAVQYSDDAGRTTWDINHVCGIMANASDPLTGLVNVTQAYANYDGRTGCVNLNYAEMIYYYQTDTGTGLDDHGLDTRSWFWQTCTEFGFFQTRKSSSLPISSQISLAYFQELCQDLFGIPAMTPDVDRTNAVYGGNAIVTSNTLFTGGDIDPWHALGNFQTYAPGSGSTSQLIHGSAHCADLYIPFPSDPPSLVQVRQQQQQFISQWLGVSQKEEQTIREE